eukprot:Blabericola_migrator_1__9735@NODE_532_length_7786_cov_102_495531_g405_i0_p5_GENE_NODE_532_length_7786_cov_102_495531_g405_i0NODE_532_length_7786_cov_102_495531_g405_i0_p5_ORF_typecomplete_len254_score43_83UPF0029/PF01205_19/1_4e07RWD/PF05773_22/1_3e06DUF3142/PF11340_8/1_4e02DUF3142/PF11340_8/2_9_NODE_532_length_7786_cov_102_495531_g405_i054756236
MPRPLKWRPEIYQEIEAIKAVFGEEHVIEDVTRHRISVNDLDPCGYDPRSIVYNDDDWIIMNDKGLIQKSGFDVDISVPKTYPEIEPCHLTITAHWLTQPESEHLADKVKEMFVPGCEWLVSALIQLTTDIPVDQLHQYIRASLNTLKKALPSKVVAVNTDLPDEEESCLKEDKTTISDKYKIVIHHGKQLVDRKSVFQGHYATVCTQEEVQDVIGTLYQYNRIARATHNMVAYRFEVSVYSINSIRDDLDDA